MPFHNRLKWHTGIELLTAKTFLGLKLERVAAFFANRIGHKRSGDCAL